MDPLDALVDAAEAEFQRSVEAGRKDRTLTDYWRSVAAPPTAALAEGIGRFFQGMTQSGTRAGPGAFMEPAGPVQKAVGEGLAPMIIPQTPTQAALMALPAVRGFGALSTAGRVGLPTVAGAGVSSLTGEGALSGAAQGAFVGGISEGIRGGLKGARWFKQRVTTGARERAIAEEFTPRFGNAVVQDIPALASVSPRTGERALLIRDPAEGMAALKKSMDLVDGGIISLFGQRPIAVPLLAQSRMAKAMSGTKGMGAVDPLGLTGAPQNLSVADALTELRLLKQAAFGGRPKGMEGYAMQSYVRQAEREFVAAVAAKDAQLAIQYKQAAQDFDKGLNFLGAAKDMGIGGDVKGALLAPQLVRTYLRENIETFSRSRFPNIWRAAFPEEYGASDVVTKLAGERLYTPLPGSPRVSIPLGEITLTQRVGATPLSNPWLLPRLGGLGAAALGSAVSE